MKPLKGKEIIYRELTKYKNFSVLIKHLINFETERSICILAVDDSPFIRIHENKKKWCLGVYYNKHEIEKN